MFNMDDYEESADNYVPTGGSADPPKVGVLVRTQHVGEHCTYTGPPAVYYKTLKC